MRESTRMWVNRSSAAAANLLWPSCCVICQRRGQFSIDLCRACESLLPPLTRASGAQAECNLIESLCVTCGSAVTCTTTTARTTTRTTATTRATTRTTKPGRDEQSNRDFASIEEPLPEAIKCAACVNSTTHFADILSPYRFDFPLDHLVHRLKYQHRREFARVFGVLLAKAVRKRMEQPGSIVPMPELLVPVPTHSERLAHRDFNQAADMARWCAAELGLRVVPGWATRIVDTPSLAGLSRAERQLCIRGAFSVDARVADRHVAIVDDVLTSGATTGELARELLDSGAASVQLWVLARTASEGSSSSRRSCSGSEESPDDGQLVSHSAW